MGGGCGCWLLCAVVGKGLQLLGVREREAAIRKESLEAHTYLTRDGVSLGKATSTLICELQVISAMPKSIDPLPPLWGWGLLKLPDYRAIMSRAHMRKDENARELPESGNCAAQSFFPTFNSRIGLAPADNWGRRN